MTVEMSLELRQMCSVVMNVFDTDQQKIAKKNVRFRNNLPILIKMIFVYTQVEFCQGA